MNQVFGNYQLREAAGAYWLIDMAQSGEDFRMPLQLNETGAILFSGLCEGLDEKALAQKLAAEYGIAKEELIGDVRAFFAQLSANGIRFE